ncbi:MAG TPA: hypothetical protein VGD75_02335 [Bradyrhizobium sp.]
MTARCRETQSPTAVDITCRTTKCSFHSSDTANHVTDVANNRSGSLYSLEVCVVSFAALVDFTTAGNKKSVTVGSIVGSGHAAHVSTGMLHAGTVGTEEIQTTVEFYDATQRIGHTSFSGAKESYDIAYEFDLI